MSGRQVKHFGKCGEMDKQIELDTKDVIRSIGDLNQQFSGKNILLTGSAGFLGCQLNDSGILSAPCHLYAWDNHLRGTPNCVNQLK